MDAKDLTTHVRNRVQITRAAGHSYDAIANRAGFSRQKLSAWMLRPDEMDIQLKTADRVCQACGELLQENR